MPDEDQGDHEVVFGWVVLLEGLDEMTEFLGNQVILNQFMVRLTIILVTDPPFNKVFLPLLAVRLFRLLLLHCLWAFSCFLDFCW
jgi:hypothetical protein